MIHVLIVEDEISTLNLLKIIVNWEDFHMKVVGTASNGREALFQIKKLKPDLIVTDIKMPIMDGITLAQEVHKDYPQVKVMIVTAYEDIKLAQSALRCGVVDFILKPLKRQEIREALERVQNLFAERKQTVESDGVDLLERAKEFLDENYFQAELSLSSVAEKMHVNPSYLSRTFSKKYGLTLIEYLNRVRIGHACDYLKESEWKIYQVAEKVGIPNPDYFTKCFRKIVGVSVREYRESQKSAENSKNS